MLIGFSGWWTPYPNDETRAKEYIRELLSTKAKQLTTRAPSPLYEKLRPGDKLDLWWKKRGQPAIKNLKYGTATCVHKDYVYIDRTKKEVRLNVPGVDCSKWTPLKPDDLEAYAAMDTHSTTARFFEVFTSGRHVRVFWGDTFKPI